MKSIKNILILTTLLVSLTSCIAQIKNAKTTQVKIYGNCGMCEKIIEKAGNLKNISSVDWDKGTKMASLKFDAKKTSQDEILKRIALVGYDSDKFLAPDDVYNNLHGCCQYDREAKVAVKAGLNIGENNSNDSDVNSIEKQETNKLAKVYENYFALKDALVKTNGELASEASKTLVIAINAIKMEELQMDVHMVWMKVVQDLKKDALAISATTDSKIQRSSFDTLSESMYTLVKISKLDTTVYVQHCPMANNGKGANWLSKEKDVKNPYYGSKMLSCGKVMETVK
jgi:hypothetical protein